MGQTHIGVYKLITHLNILNNQVCLLPLARVVFIDITWRDCKFRHWKVSHVITNKNELIENVWQGGYKLKNKKSHNIMQHKKIDYYIKNK